MKHIYIAGFMALGCALTLPSYANTLTLVNQSGVDLTVNNTQGSSGGGDVKSGETKTLTVDANTAYQMTYLSIWHSPQGVLTMKQDPTSYSIQHTAVNPASGLLNLQVMINGGQGSFNTLNPADPRSACALDTGGITCNMGSAMPDNMTITVSKISNHKQA